MSNQIGAIQAAVEWWSQWLQKPSPQITGDDTLNIWLTYASLVSSPVASDEQAEKFKTCLQSAVETEIVNYGYCMLDVDYSPRDTLWAVCKSSGVSGNFPCKTMMRVEPGYVSVRCGYGASDQVLFDQRDKQEEQ